MTKNEFIEKLEKPGRIDFEGSILSAPTRELLTPIIKSISLALPDGEVIAHGVQLGELSGGPDSWEGKLIWLLSLRLHVLALTADVRYEGTGKQRTTRLHVEHQFYRKERVKANLRVRWGHVLEHAHLSLHCDDDFIEVLSRSWLSPDALCRFAASILG